MSHGNTQRRTYPRNGWEWYFANYRPLYPESVIDRLARIVGRPCGRVVDIGCGTGQLSIPLARRGFRVVGVDRWRGLILEAERLAGQMVTDVLERPTFVVGVAEALADVLDGPADAVIFSKSFHWTKRDAALDAAKAILSPSGPVIVINSKMRQDEWMRVAMAVAREFTPPSRPFTVDPDQIPESAASLLRKMGSRRVVERCLCNMVASLTIDEVVRYWLAMPDCSMDRLGVRADTFIDRLRDTLLRVNKDGVFDVHESLEILSVRVGYESDTKGGAP